MDPRLPFKRWFDDFARQESTRTTPWVTVAYAQSLDGSIAAKRGQPFRLSSPDSLLVTHHARAAHDAILVGIGTILADDPQLTARGVDGLQPQPVVLDSHLRIPAAARLWAHPKSPWIASLTCAPEDHRKRLVERKAILLEFHPDQQNLIPLERLLEELWQRGVRRLMVEGGASVISQFLRQELVDGVFITIAPVYLGGLPILDGPVQQKLSDVVVECNAKDILVWGRLG